MTVPAALLQPYVARFVGEPEWMDGPLPGLATLAEKTALSYDTIQRVLTRDGYVVEFDVADRILCALNAVQAWYEEPLSEIYQGHPLREIAPPSNRCQRTGCTNGVPPKIRGQQPKYCSKNCRAVEQRRRRHRRRGIPIGKRFGTKHGHCPSGHDRSEENVGYRSGGILYCKECSRQKAKQHYEANRERIKAAERARRARKKAAA